MIQWEREERVEKKKGKKSKQKKEGKKDRAQSTGSLTGLGFSLLKFQPIGDSFTFRLLQKSRICTVLF